MVVSLELRRRAIVEALRAVMAEPSPIVNRDRTVPSAVAKPGIPTLRDSLTAAIDWDEVDSIDLEPAEVPPVATTVVDADDATAPPVPPVELTGAMSSTASIALFGHE